VQVMQDLRKWPNNLRQRIYDLRHNVDTWEPIPLDKLHIESGEGPHFT
jgi:hypothetical protein